MLRIHGSQTGGRDADDENPRAQACWPCFPDLRSAARLAELATTGRTVALPPLTGAEARSTRMCGIGEPADVSPPRVADL